MRYLLFGESEIGEVRGVDTHLFDRPNGDLDSQLVQLEQVTEPISIDEFQRWRSVARCLSSGFCRESAGRDQEPLIAASGHRSAEVSDCAHGERLIVRWAVPR